MTKPYEDSLSIEQLRKEVREAWDFEHALMEAIKNKVELPEPWILARLDQAAGPEDKDIGLALRRSRGFDMEGIPPKFECETGAGVWYRIRQGLLSDAKPE